MMMGEPMSRAASRAALTVLEFKSTREKKKISLEPRPQQSLLISEQRHSSVKPIKRDSSRENRSSSIDPLHPKPSTEQINKKPYLVEVQLIAGMANLLALAIRDISR
jgi:hypothetical protein